MRGGVVSMCEGGPKQMPCMYVSRNEARYSLADLWRNHLARTAPGRVAVNDLQDVLLVHGGLVLRSGLQVVHALTHGG